MQPFHVVIFDICSNILLHMLSGWLSNFEQPIMLQTAEEPFYYSIIPTRANITHTSPAIKVL
jgi:hypothetical protein